MSLWLSRKQAPVPDQLVGLAVHLLTLHHCARATMKIVALSHGKRRFCSFSSGKHGPIRGLAGIVGGQEPCLWIHSKAILAATRGSMRKVALATMRNVAFEP
jgi:hypothetical protein